MQAPALDEEEMQEVYQWIDEIPLTRPKKNIGRDFADGVLAAEVIKHFFPKMVEIHNYSNASSSQQKLYNWNTLNAKVLKKIGFQLSKKDIEDIVKVTPDTIERVLRLFKLKIEEHKQRRKQMREEGRSIQTADAGMRGGVQGQVGGYPGGMQAQNMMMQKMMASNMGMGMGGMGGMPMGMGMGMGMNPGMNPGGDQNAVDSEIVLEKEQTINELKETVEILELKIKKLEQLVRLKDSKIQTLTNKLNEAGIY